MSVSWPDSLPAPLIKRSHEINPRSDITLMESQRQRVRRLYDGPIELLTVQWNFLDDQYEAFQFFFNNLIGEGVDSFILVTYDASSTPGRAIQVTRLLCFLDGTYKESQSDNLYIVSAVLLVQQETEVEVPLPIVPTPTVPSSGGGSGGSPHGESSGEPESGPGEHSGESESASGGGTSGPPGPGEFGGLPAPTGPGPDYNPTTNLPCGVTTQLWRPIFTNPHNPADTKGMGHEPLSGNPNDLDIGAPPNEIEVWAAAVWALWAAAGIPASNARLIWVWYESEELRFYPVAALFLDNWDTVAAWKWEIWVELCPA